MTEIRMGRIRTIKPEFWKHEDLCALPESTHLLAAALLNYADDYGYFNANPALVKAECSPLREPLVSIPESLRSLQEIGFIALGNCDKGRTYGRIVNFDVHQRVSHPSKSKIADISITWAGSGDPPEILRNPPEILRPEQGTGNREKEQGTGNREGIAVPALVADATATCPVEQIVDLYNSKCTALPQVRTLTDGRRKAIRARWRESPERQDLNWWSDLFSQVARSPFLIGANDRNWTADFDWILKPTNLPKVSEGRYSPSPLARFSKTTQSNLHAAQEFINGAA
jgi:hypothetical protein